MSDAVHLITITLDDPTAAKKNTTGMCVCVCVWMYVCMCVCVYVCVG